MNRRGIEKLNKRLNYIGIYQILGGVTGIVYIIFVLLQVDGLSGPNVLMIGFGTSLHGFSVYCGNKLVKKSTGGIKLSIINQLIQCIHFKISGWGFSFVAGISTVIGFDISDDFEFKTKFAVSTWEFAFNLDSGEIFVGLNLIATALIVYLDKVRQEKEHELTKEQTSEKEEEAHTA